MHLASFDGALIIGEGKAVVTAFLLKRRILRRPGKEILKRLAQGDHGHLQCVFSHLQHPRKCVAFDGIALTSQGHLGRFRQRRVAFARIIWLLPVIEGPIVGEAGDARRLAKVRLLHIVGIEGRAPTLNRDPALAPLPMVFLVVARYAGNARRISHALALGYPHKLFWQNFHPFCVSSPFNAFNKAIFA